MQLNEIIFYYPSYEKGGVENIIKNLLKYAIGSKIKFHLISSSSIIELKQLSNFSKVKKYKNRLITSLFSIINLITVLFKNYKRRKKISKIPERKICGIQFSI